MLAREHKVEQATMKPTILFLSLLIVVGQASGQLNPVYNRVEQKGGIRTKNHTYFLEEVPA
jgi:hypothetical protein